jgi:endoglucanase
VDERKNIMRHYSLNFIYAAMASMLILAARLPASPAEFSKFIMVDQFGYRPDDTKIAVLVDPQSGFNAADAYQPGSTLQVRRRADDSVVFSGAPRVWNKGATHDQSGDKGWWFDFSSVTTPGAYYVYDEQNAAASAQFEIRRDVYFNVLKAAFKMYYYNRCSIAKVEPYADPRWVDGPSFAGSQQDGEARDVNDKKNAASAKDLSGGWFDAGDFNKYVTFAEGVIHQLLDAYTQNPVIWSDAFNIPESGNGIPDIIDEIIWELDWLKKMQDIQDGGVHIKNGSITYTQGSPPSSDKALRYYGPKCSSSTIAASGMFAHAAIVLSQISGLSDYAQDLRSRALLAWDWYHANPKGENCDTQEIKSGDADKSVNDQNQMAVTAAVYLFALTEEKEYDDYVVANYRKVENLNWWGPYRTAEGEALLYYSQLSIADAAVIADILNKKSNNARSLSDFYKQSDTQDLYRAYMPDAQYHWGSNSVKANTGIINYDMVYYGLDSGDEDSYIEKALGCLHYFHGVNPLNKVYLTNMAGYGAENSVNEIYHGWFANGSPWDNVLKSAKGPAPGYVPGGPNKSYSGSEPGIKDQPPQKAYKDGNGYVNSWEVTEPSLGYQSAYLKLLSKFVEYQSDSVDDHSNGNAGLPSSIAVYQNYPNPFNPRTQIRFKVNRPSRISMRIYDILGELVVTLADKQVAQGEHKLDWDARDSAGNPVRTGVFVCKLSAQWTGIQAGHESAVIKMLMIR